MVASMGNFGCVGNSGNPWEIDPLFLAGRVAMSPLDYKGVGSVLGHYGIAQRSGNLTATPLAANSHLAGVRWTDTTRYFVLLRLKFGLTVSGAITTSLQKAFAAYILRGFSVSWSGNNTAIDMSTIVGTGKMRYTMGTSLLGTVGPQICTTAGFTGNTSTQDAAPFSNATFANPSTTLGAAAVTAQVGAGCPMQTLYEVTSPYQHPIVLTANEGIVVQNILAGDATGTFNVHWELAWAEVNLFLGL